MVTAGFGIKILYDRDLLLTESHGLVYYGNGTRGVSTLNAPTNVYFYIDDFEININNNDINHVTEVTELSKIPIYRGNNPKFSLWKDDFKRKELIDESNVCLFYYHDFDNNKLRFFLHYSYKGVIKEFELNNRVLSLLKYTWLTSQSLTYTDFQQFGDFVYDHVSNIDVDKIINDMRIISGEKTFYGKDSESTHFYERWIIDTNDFYIINSLLELSKKLFPRRFDDQTTLSYGPSSLDEFRSFDISIILRNARLDSLQRLISNKSNGFDESKCIKYILLWNSILHPSGPSGIKLDAETLEIDKTEIIKKAFLQSYSVGKHIAGLFFIESESIKVPDDLMTQTIAAYKEWKYEEVLSSNLHHLTIYWGAKDICSEFNKRSNDRFNFNIDFSIFPKTRLDINDFDWDAYEKS